MTAPAYVAVNDAAEAPGWARSVKLTRLDLRLTPAAPWRLPPQPGVTLRGALGEALQRLVCVSPGTVCGACPSRGACLVPGWLDPGRVGGAAGRPLVPWVHAAGGAWVSPERPLAVTLWVLGEAPDEARLVEALCQLASRGLGPGRTPHTLTRLLASGAGGPALLVADGARVGAWPGAGSLADHLVTPRRPVGAVVRLVSPTFWTGALPDVAPSPGAVIQAMMRRARQVSRDQGGAVHRYWPSTAGLRGLWTELEWTPGARYSARQGETVPLGGFTGALTLGPEVAPYADLLAAATVLGVGKNTGCGLGRVVVDWREA